VASSAVVPAIILGLNFEDKANQSIRTDTEM
jgi:hypothetical protein